MINIGYDRINLPTATGEWGQPQFWAAGEDDWGADGVVWLCVHTLSRSPLKFMRAHSNPRGGPGNIQGITHRSARGCACVRGYEGVPIFVESALWLLTGCCLFGHQVICNYTVHPAVTVAIVSGETNDFVKQSWCQYLIKYEHLCINSPPKARMQWVV